jgi:tetratricopeptide (TPR) repeat protein
MSKDTAKNRFIVFPMPRLYQYLFTGIANYDALGKQIIREIKAAHAFRQIEHVRELSKLLINLPMQEYRVIAQYYLLWCDCRELKYDTAALERIVERTQTYKTQALFSRGAIDWYRGNNEQALCFYTEALKTSPALLEYIDLTRTIAVLKSQEGFHNSALKDLEKLVPLIKHAEPRLYYDFLNSYAVELIEAGRKDEARNMIRFVLASPFIHAYPEWKETARDLKETNRSFAAIKPISLRPRNVLSMPVIQYVNTRQMSYNQPARVFNLQHWKKKMGKESEDKPTDQLTDREALLKIVDLASTPGLSDEALLEMVKALQEIVDKVKRTK